MSSKSIFSSVALAALASFASIPDSNARVLFAATLNENFSFSTASATIPITRNASNLPLTVISLNAPLAGTYILTYSAECAVRAPAANNEAYLDLDILVNNVAMKPTVGTEDAFCAANGTSIFDGWARNSITVAVPLVAGSNRVQIKAKIWAGATGGWIGDSSLVVHD